MHFLPTRSIFAGLLLSVHIFASAGGYPPSANADPSFFDQGQAWTTATRADFYSRDQGSRVMPLKWMTSLKQKNGQPFIGDSLSRYGYLPNPLSIPAGLPVGFTVTSSPIGPMIGMTCAACHTRQIEIAGTPYRVDGGPAIVDFGAFLTDLDASVASIVATATAFDVFATSVLGQTAPADAKARLKADVSAWFVRFDTLMKNGMPTIPWGPARVDAVGMIFNRLAGLDLGPAPTRLIVRNIHRADAPVRYPFLWNAAIQDKTQWPGFADNGSDILGLARNLGEVYGVFAEFSPTKSNWRPLGVDYWDNNSANIHGLQAIENLIRNIGPPKWPWGLDTAKALRGKEIFSRNAAGGGCTECHGRHAGITRFYNKETLCTPIINVGTDVRQYDVLNWEVETGVLNGAKIPFLKRSLNPTEKAFNVLGTAVTGSILQFYLPIGAAPTTLSKASTDQFTAETEELRGAFNAPGFSETAGLEPGVSPTAIHPTSDACHVATPPAGAYESRVLEGIWASAPYLHNGSVASLSELLKPSSQRASSFKIGPAYDITSVGLAAEQSKFDYEIRTTDCSDIASGNSRCGHEFGTKLSDDEKKALLEYLKSL